MLLGFSLLLHPPPQVLLFPYTTLFRSQLRELAERDFLTGLLNTRAFDEALARRCSSGASASSNARADRKSTRLNSSHRCISYAVFCLKKKIDSREIFQIIKR